MRYLFLFLLASLGGCSASAADTQTDTYTLLLSKTGVLKVLKALPADIQRAANQNAARCGNPSVDVTLSSTDFSDSVRSSLRQRATPVEVQSLVTWYTTFTGRKVRRLERQEVDAGRMQQHTADEERMPLVRKIYQHTNTAGFVADIAVEIEYAGWRLSHCVQKAASSGDIKALQMESTRGQLIRGEAQTLRTLFEADILREMEYVLSALDKTEQAEYADVAGKHAALYTAVIDSMIDAIRTQSEQIMISAVR